MEARLTARDQVLRTGTWIVIASEALIFSVLLASHGGVRPAPTLRELALMGSTALALAFGCVAITAAIYHARSGRTALARRRMTVVLVLGTLALLLEMTGTALFTTLDPLGLVIFSLHAGHVAAAVVLAALVAGLCRSGRGGHALPVVGAYWYFIAILWIFVAPLLTTR